MTSGLGLIVSRFPLGICSTKLIELGTAVTIRDPRSSFLDKVVVEAVSPTLKFDNSLKGTNIASCVFVVKMTKFEATVKEVTFPDRIEDSELAFAALS